jgi:hypothetical protein
VWNDDDIIRLDDDIVWHPLAFEHSIVVEGKPMLLAV